VRLGCWTNELVLSDVKKLCITVDVIIEQVEIFISYKNYYFLAVAHIGILNVPLTWV